MPSKNVPPAKESVTDREFVISRVFDAPRELVWRAWTEPQHLAQWWGPKGMTNPVCELEVRPGGACCIVMRTPEGTEYPMKGVFVEIVPPERLVLTMDVSGHPKEWHDAIDPQRKPGENPVGEMLQTVTFEDLQGKTRQTVHTRFRNAAIAQAMVKMGMNEGWSQSLDRLEALLSHLA